MLKTNGTVVIHHLGETYNHSSFIHKFPNYGITAPSSSRAEYVQNDMEDNETPRRALTFQPDLDALIEVSSEEAWHITEPEADYFYMSHDLSDMFQTLSGDETASCQDH